MKALLIALTVGLALGLSYASFAAVDQAQRAKMEKCYKAHGNLMEKPSVQQLDACWRMHGQRMSTK